MSDWQHPTPTTRSPMPYHDAPVSRRVAEGAVFWCPRCERAIDTLPETHVEDAHDGQHLRTTIMMVVEMGDGRTLAVNPVNDCGPDNHTWPPDSGEADAGESRSCTVCDAVRNPSLSASTEADD